MSPMATRSASSTTRPSTRCCYAAKAGMHGLCTNQHHQNVYGFMANPEHHGRGACASHQRPERRDHPARLDLALDHAADPHRRGIRDARLHQRRTAGRRISDRPAGGCRALQRRGADRAARALSRGAGARDQGLVGEGGVRLERQALSARHGEPVAAADPAAASADLDSGRRHLGDRRIRRRP